MGSLGCRAPHWPVLCKAQELCRRWTFAVPGQTHPSPFPERCLSQRALLQKMLVSCFVQVQTAGTGPGCKRFGRAEQHSAQPSVYRCLLRRGAWGPEQLLQGTAPSFSQQHLNELGNRGCASWQREDRVVEAKSDIPACVKAQLSRTAQGLHRELQGSSRVFVGAEGQRWELADGGALGSTQ